MNGTYVEERERVWPVWVESVAPNAPVDAANKTELPLLCTRCKRWVENKSLPSPNLPLTFATLFECCPGISPALALTHIDTLLQKHSKQLPCIVSYRAAGVVICPITNSGLGHTTGASATLAALLPWYWGR